MKAAKRASNDSHTHQSNSFRPLITGAMIPWRRWNMTSPAFRRFVGGQREYRPAFVVAALEPDDRAESPYVEHLSKSAFQEMKRAHRGAALERAVAEWIAERDR